MITFNRTYFSLAILLLAIEIAIALYIPDGFIRHYVGDVLVVILIYCFVLSFMKLPVMPTAIGVLVFAYGIEILQYFKLVDILGLSDSRLASVILGSTFDWMDMVMYTLGIVLVLLAENFSQKKETNSRN